MFKKNLLIAVIFSTSLIGVNAFAQLFIETNISALVAQRNLQGEQQTLNTSLSRLSSGLRINSATDNPNRFFVVLSSDQAKRLAQDADLLLAQVSSINDTIVKYQAKKALIMQALVASLNAQGVFQQSKLVEHITNNAPHFGLYPADGQKLAQQIGAIPLTILNR